MAAAIIGVLAVSGGVGLALPEGARHLAVALLSASLLVPLIWCRRLPLPVFGFMAGVALAQVLVGVPSFVDIGLVVGLYAVITRCPRGQAIAAIGFAEFGVTLQVSRWWATDGGLPSAILLSGLVATAVVAGVAVRNIPRIHVSRSTVGP